jgi:YebC/PmpR family DNA-binding regulatory protein
MPKDNIQRAIKRGTGELDGGNLEEILYEGYGSGGVAILCEVLTDNRNRTAGEIRKIFELSDGKLGSTGCVAWMFESKGLFLIPSNAIEEDKLMELALEAGADDVQSAGENFEVTCDPAKYSDVSKAIAEAGIKPESSQITRIAKNTVDINEPEAAQRVLRLMDNLDDQDDVQNVSANFNISDEVLKAIGEG